MGRHVARAVESRNIIDHLYKLLDAYAIGESNINQVDFAPEGYGQRNRFLHSGQRRTDTPDRGERRKDHKI